MEKNATHTNNFAIVGRTTATIERTIVSYFANEKDKRRKIWDQYNKI